MPTMLRPRRLALATLASLGSGLALASLPATALAQPLTTAEAARVDAVFSRFTSATPGCALGVRRNGQLAYAKGYGLASLELGVPISSRTVFDIGSTSKQFTAASVALLALEGRLSLDDDVRKFVPELPDLGQPVTLRRLLSHTSGWRDYIDLMMYEGWDDRDHTTDREAIAALVRQRGFNFPPGAEFRYSNTGFFLMSLVVQRVSGQSLADFARARFFAPLGMTSTKYLTDAREVIPDKASAYAPEGPGKWSVAMSDWEQIGDGGVQTTVEDLARWDAAFESGSVAGGRALVELLTTPTKLADGKPTQYGLGLFVDDYRGLARVQHGGAWAGFRAMLMRYPSLRLSMLIACNVADANTMGLATGVSDALLPAAALAAKPNAGADFGSRVDREPRTYAVDAAKLADYAGTYASDEAGAEWTMVVREGKLVLSPKRGPEMPLRPVAADEFGGPGRVRFERDASGRVVALTVTTRGAEALRFTRR